MKLTGALILAVVLLAGCSKAPTVVGKWKVAPEVEKSSPAGTPPGFMTGFASTFKYEFKEDKSFTAPMSEGTYTTTEKSISIKTNKIAGQDISKMNPPQMTGELSADGETLTLHPPQSKLLPASLSSIKMIREK